MSCLRKENFTFSGELQTEDDFSKLRSRTQRRPSKSILLAWGKNKVEIPWRSRALKTLNWLPNNKSSISNSGKKSDFWRSLEVNILVYDPREGMNQSLALPYNTIFKFHEEIEGRNVVYGAGGGKFQTTAHINACVFFPI